MKPYTEMRNLIIQMDRYSPGDAPWKTNCINLLDMLVDHLEDSDPRGEDE